MFPGTSVLCAGLALRRSRHPETHAFRDRGSALADPRPRQSVIAWSNQRVRLTSLSANKKGPSRGSFFIGGERGIRTLDTGLSPYNALAGRHLRPLGHLSAAKSAKNSTTMSAIFPRSRPGKWPLLEPFQPFLLIFRVRALSGRCGVGGSLAGKVSSIASSRSHSS